MSSLGLRFDAGELMASLRLAPLDIRVKATETWAAKGVADFRQFRQAGRSNSLMDKIEALFDAND